MGLWLGHGTSSKGKMPWPQTGVTHYHALLGPADKVRAIKGLVVCWSMARINDLWDGSMVSARCVVWSFVAVRMAIELRYRNAP